MSSAREADNCAKALLPLNMSTVVHSALARLGKRCSDEQHNSPRAHRPVASRVSLAQDRNHVLESFPERPTIPR